MSVLSGNRNFEGRINPDVKMNYLASPPLCVAYAIAGTMDIDIVEDPSATTRWARGVPARHLALRAGGCRDGRRERPRGHVPQELRRGLRGDERWRGLPVPEGERFDWEPASTYVRLPPYFEDMPREPAPLREIEGARVLALLGDSVTTDHISPAGSIKRDSPAGTYLQEQGVGPRDFNSYGARRGNHEVMVRGTFANIRLRNLLAADRGALPEGGYTYHLSDRAPSR